jgi:hypothetical protein
MEEVELEVELRSFMYLGGNIEKDGGMKSEMKHRVSEREKSSGVLMKM